MNASITLKGEDSQVELDIVVTIKEFQPFIEKAARKLSKDAPIKGFRPGKAPVQSVVEHVGQERLMKNAMDTALPHFFVKAAIDNEVEAINRPSIVIKQLGIDEPLHFIATVDVLPSVTLGDPAAVSVKKRGVTVEGEHIKKELNQLARMRSTYLDVARPAQKGDVVTVDFQILIDGQVIEDGESKQHPITIGDGYFIPDFEKNITGIQANEDREFTVTFPDNFPKKEMCGKQTQARVHAHSVQKRVVPELNDEFAKNLGASFKSLSDLKKQLHKNMKKELEKQEHERYLGEIVEKLAESSTFGYISDALIEKEIDNRIEEFGSMLAYQQKTIDDYMKEHNTDIKKMRDTMREAAEKQIKIGLTLRTFAVQHDVQVEDEEVEKEVNQQLQRFKTIQQAEQEIDSQELRENVVSLLRNRKVLAKIAELSERKPK